MLNQAQGNSRPAERALDAIGCSLALIESSPFACRRAPSGEAWLGELLIGLGKPELVALFEVDDASTLAVLAVRPHRESAYR